MTYADSGDFDLPGLDDYLDDQQAGMHTCPHCKQRCFFDPETRPTKPGQVYSQAGMAELNITGYCEHCFDEITREPDEPPDDSHARMEDAMNNDYSDRARWNEL